MLPIRTRTIFRSRWMALLWSAGIIWSAVSFVGSADDAGTGNESEAIDPTTVNAIEALLGNSTG